MPFQESVAPPFVPPLHMPFDPRENQVRDLQIVLVLHEHVAVTEQTCDWQMQHLRVATRSVDLVDELLAAVEGPNPQARNTRDIGKVVTEYDEAWNLRKSCNLRLCQWRRAHAFD